MVRKLSAWLYSLDNSVITIIWERQSVIPFHPPLRKEKQTTSKKAKKTKTKTINLINHDFINQSRPASWTTNQVLFQSLSGLWAI